MADPQQSSPSVPTISPQQVSGVYDIPDTSMDMQKITQLAFPQQGPAPNTTVLTRSQAPVVNVPRASTYTPLQEHTPVNDSSEERIRARHHNQFTGITNAIGSYVQKRSEEKTDALKVQITSVLAAQKRIAEAQTVLQNDPNNANAKAVLDSNRKIMDGILDGKNGKAVQKAFDISFVDPQKNKTPEVKAGQEALKEFKKNSEQGHDINNPQEAAIASAAGNNAPTVQATVPGNQRPDGKNSGPPVLNQRPGVQLNPNSNTQGVRMAPPGATTQASTVPTSGNSHASTPYADQFLAKQALELDANPQYAVYKEQQDKQQEQAAKLLPTLIKAETEKQIKLMSEKNANARADAKNWNEYQEKQQQMQNALKIAKGHDSAAYSRVVLQGKNMMAREMVKANVALGILSDDPKNPLYKGSALGKQVGLKTLTSMQNNISKETKDLNEVQTQYSVLLQSKPKEMSDEDYRAAVESGAAIIKFDQWNIQQMVALRQQFAHDTLGLALPPAQQPEKPAVAKSDNGGMLSGILSETTSLLGINNGQHGAPNGQQQSANAPRTEVVDRNESDAEGDPGESDSGDIDPDSYDQ